MEKLSLIEIEDYGYDGEGVGKINGKVVFVPYALKNEKVQVSLKDNKSSFANGQLIFVEEESPLRQEAPCPYFGACGGCAYQHTSYQNELEIKKDLLSRQLSKVKYRGEIEVNPSPEHYFYRNKIRLFVGEKGLALRERKGGRVCFIEKCLIVEKEINRIMECVNTFILTGNHQKDYKEVVIRKEDDSLLINFYKTSKANINYQGLYLILGRNIGIFETSSTGTVHKIGRKQLDCNEFGLKCKFSPLSFHQVNDAVGKGLYKKVLDNLVGKNILNCYSGAGVLSGIIAMQGKRVVGVEIGKTEHRDAEALKEENNLFYLSNMRGDCAEVLPKLFEKFDCVVIDPPRGGIAEKVVKVINDFECQRLIYISCNSATLVRDLSRLDSYKIKSVELFDMFARTGEYETLVVLDKIK